MAKGTGPASVEKQASSAVPENLPTTTPKPPAVAPKLANKPPEKPPEKPAASLTGPGVAGSAADSRSAPAVQPPAPGPSQCLAVPDEEDQKKAEATIRNDLMKKDFDAADRPAKRILLARELLYEGRPRRGGPADNATVGYVLLRLACQEAANGDTETAMAAIDALDARFQIDALAMKLEAFETLSRSPAAAVLPAVVVGKMLAATAEAVKEDRYDLSDRLIALAKSVIAKARDAALAKQINARGKQAAEGKQAYQAMEEPLRELERQPSDPAFNEVVGKYYCLGKGRWQRGLPKLAACANGQLKKLAETELSAPQDAHARLDLADAWWDLSESLDPPEQRQVRLHAAEWYQKAALGLTGLSQTKAQQRSAEAAAGAGGEATAADVPDKWDNLQCRDPLRGPSC